MSSKLVERAGRSVWVSWREVGGTGKYAGAIR